MVGQVFGRQKKGTPEGGVPKTEVKRGELLHWGKLLTGLVLYLSVSIQSVVPVCMSVNEIYRKDHINKTKIY